MNLFVSDNSVGLRSDLARTAELRIRALIWVDLITYFFAHIHMHLYLHYQKENKESVTIVIYLSSPLSHHSI